MPENLHTTGRFVAVEGLDGSGGTTQVQRLGAALADAHLTREPSDGPIGRLIRRSLAEPELASDAALPYLFAADRQDHLDREIAPALAAGRWVVSDRYYASSLAYQSLAAPLDFIASLNARFRAPDLTIFLDLDVGACVERIEARRAATGATIERFETQARLEEISAAYGVVLAMLAQRGERIRLIDARGTPEAVHARVMDEIRALT